ncbi:MAG: hypothetical protein ABI317_17220 [Gaiellales bacterium]
MPVDGDDDVFFVAIDHAFVGDEFEGLAQDVYDALGALDAACQAAVLPLGRADLCALVDAGDRLAGNGAGSPGQRELVAGAARRLRHALERG